MTFKNAQVELQYGPGGYSLVVKNTLTGYCFVVDLGRNKVEQFEDVFGSDVKEQLE